MDEYSVVTIKTTDTLAVAFDASRLTYERTFSTESKIGNEKILSVLIGNFPISNVSQKDKGTMDIMRKNTSVPANVEYFFAVNN